MKLVSLLFAISLILAACSAAPQTILNPTQPSSSGSVANQPAPTTASSSVEAASTSSPNPSSEEQSSSTEDLVRTDEQGAVVVQVTPANLANPGEALEFEVELNTHSVDLSMDLAALATLTTDNGKTIQAIKWDASKGGHHVSGKLIFPATVDGQPVLEGAKKLTLTIKNLDAPERIFSWDLGE